MLRLTMCSAALLVVVVTTAFGAEPVAEFIRRHWAAPLAPQGAPPAGWSALESSLHPESCGTCHPVQLGDWRTSAHAVTMGPGVAGQLDQMALDEPASALECPVCHAPLAEQSPLVRGPEGLVANPAFDPALRGKGVVCAACHVRGHERFGPPRRDGSLVSDTPRQGLPHRGVTRTPAYLSSEFCRDCHQFTADGFAVNGKLLQNTYEEWKASPFARQGVQCQDCHMPDRRHLWRGIHDPEMVRKGLTITVTRGSDRYRLGDDFTVDLTVRNTGVGHAFPTYVTPRVVMRGDVVNGAGAPIPASRRELVIAREVALDLSREAFDTRLLADRAATLTVSGRLTEPGLLVRLSVVVEPDAFYTSFFETLLSQGAGRGEAKIREALEATRRSVFTIFVRDVPL